MVDHDKYELGTVIYQHLKALGYKDKEIRKLSRDTRFYHDMNFMGDTAWEWAEDLVKEGVDMSSFRFDEYFSPEFPKYPLWKHILGVFIWSLTPVNGIKDNYLPITLGMIEAVLIAKTWDVVLPYKTDKQVLER